MISEGETLLHAACQFSNLHIVKYLIATKGAMPEVPDQEGKTSLYAVCGASRGSEQPITPLIRYLVEAAHVVIHAIEVDNHMTVLYCLYDPPYQDGVLLLPKSCSYFSLHVCLLVQICLAKQASYLVQHGGDRFGKRKGRIRT
jgi:hypothetical protein